MRTVLLVILVVVAHIAAIAGLVVFQGCGTPVGGDLPAYGSEDVIMPPSAPVVDMPVAPVRGQHVAPPTQEPTWPVEVTTYVVRRGDSLSAIAKRFGLDVGEVMAINQIADKNVIRAGQKLILPGKHDADAPPPRRTPRAPAPVAGGSGSYVVQSGDCLSVIASRHKTSVAAIKSANNLPSDMIRVGQKLVIPGGAAVAAQSTSPVTTPAPAPAIPAPLMPDVDSAPIIDMPPAPEPVTVSDAQAGVPAPEPTAATTPEPPTGESFRTYVVGENEDLYSVGLLWNVSVAKIKEINALTDTTLKPGQRLKIPTSD